MKPKDLKCPFSWEERRVLIHDGVWYVPDHFNDYASYQFPGWAHADFFGNANPVHIEYCSGNGAWIIAKAQQNPHINWVAVEWQFERVRQIWAKAKNRKLKNLFIICGEGYTVSKNYFLQDSVQAVHVNFPDPWPKRRHGKHRLIARPFVDELSRIISSGSSLTLVTDDADYSKIMLKVMLPHASFESAFPEPHYITDVTQYGTSYFCELWQGLGRTIRYHQFIKRQAI